MKLQFFIIIFIVAFSFPSFIIGGILYLNNDLLGTTFDWVYHSSDYVKYGVLFSWWSFRSSLPRAYWEADFYQHLFSLFSFAIGNVLVAIKAYIVFQMAIAGLSMFSFSYEITKNRVCSFLSAIFYILTPFYLGQLNLHVYLMWAYALLPLVYLSFHNLLKTETKTSIIYAGLAMALGMFFPGPQFVYEVGVVASFYFFTSLLLLENRSLKTVAKKTSKIVSAFLIALLISFYFIIHYFTKVEMPFAWGQPPIFTYEYYSCSPINALFLVNHELTRHLGPALNYFNYTLLTEFLVIFASLTIISGKKYHQYYPLYLSGIFALFISLGTNSPIDLFGPIRSPLPYSYLLRKPCLFIIHSCLSFSVLSGVFMHHLLNGSDSARKRLFTLRRSINAKRFLRLLFVSLIVCSYTLSGCVLAYSAPTGPFANYEEWFKNHQPELNWNTALRVQQWLNEVDPTREYRAWGDSIYVQDHRLYKGVVYQEWLRGSPAFSRILGLHNIKYLITSPTTHNDIKSLLSGDVVSAGYGIYTLRTLTNNVYIRAPQKSDSKLGVAGGDGLSNFNYRFTRTPDYNVFELEFIVDNDAPFAQWAQIEISVPDNIDWNKDGNIADNNELWTYNATSNQWITWHSGIMSTINGTRIDGALYQDGDSGETKPLSLRTPSMEPPPNITYSSEYSILRRKLGFAFYLPADAQDGSRGDQVRVKWLVASDVVNTSQRIPTGFDSVKIDGATVYVNSFARPSVYTAPGAITFGGPNALSLFYTLDRSENWVLFFPDGSFQNPEDWKQGFSRFEYLVFHDSDYMDLLATLIEDRYKMEAWKFAGGEWVSIDQSFGPGAVPFTAWGSIFGQLVHSKKAIYTKGNESISFLSEIGEADYYNVFIRASNTFEKTNTLESIQYVDWEVGPYKGLSAVEGNGFKWMRLSKVWLEKGKYAINLKAPNPMYLDLVIVTPESYIQNLTDRLVQVLQKSPIKLLYLFEFANYLNSNKSYTQTLLPYYSSNVKTGYLTLEPGGKVKGRFFSVKGSNYTIGVRLLSSQKSNSLVLKIDGKKCEWLNDSRSSSLWTFMKSNIYLDPGDHIFEISNTKNFKSLDMMYIIEGADPFTRSIKNSRSKNELQYDFYGTSWHGRVFLNNPQYVVITETYFPKWVMQVNYDNRLVYNPLPALYTINAFFINYTGTFNFKVFYEPPRVRLLSLTISLSTFTLCCVLLLISRIRKSQKIMF